jgi:hypothetical protein
MRYIEAHAHGKVHIPKPPLKVEEVADIHTFSLQ